MDDSFFKLISDFIEGKTSFNDFERLCKLDKNLRFFLSKFKNQFLKQKVHYSFLETIDKYDWTTDLGKANIYESFYSLLLDNNIKVERNDEYLLKAQKILSLIPSWLSDEASDYVEEEIIEKAPKGLTKTETKAWIKAKIKETFKYEKRPPQWAQEGNWPRDEEGNFLTFRSQKEDGDLVTYTFVNPKTGEEVQTQEFY